MSATKTIAKPKRYAIAKYLRLEEQSDEKHEYIDGEVVPLHRGEAPVGMAGGSPRASRIAVDFITQLNLKLHGKPCQVYESNVRVRIARTPFTTCPNDLIICEKLAFAL